MVLLQRGGDAHGPLDDDGLVALMLGHRGPAAEPAGVTGTGVEPGRAPAKIGIDAPLGWPVAFIAAVADLDAWPLADEVAPVALVRRASDRWIHAETGKLPLSVSTDRIAYPAMRAARLVRRYQQATGRPIDRAGMSGAVCEVYPDTAVTRFGLRPAPVGSGSGAGRESGAGRGSGAGRESGAGRGSGSGTGGRPVSYKGAGGAAVRERMLDRLAELAPWLTLSTAQRHACVATDDHFDALIAALLTRAVQLGDTHPPPAELAADAAVEGWIHLPRPGALERLAPGGA